MDYENIALQATEEAKKTGKAREIKPASAADDDLSDESSGEESSGPVYSLRKRSSEYKIRSLRYIFLICIPVVKPSYLESASSFKG